MSAENIPSITKVQIRELATSQSFKKGVQYYRDNRITNATLQGLKLSAYCQGSSNYKPSVVFNPQNPQEIDSLKCTCPYDWGGICKHLVALLLTYCEQPERFNVIPLTTEMLANHSKEDLIKLIDRMTQRYPDLLSLVQLSFAQTINTSASPQAIDLSIYSRQAENALQQDNCENIVDALEILCDIGEDFLQNQDYLNAGNFYQLLLEQMNEHYEGILWEMDYDGDVCCFSQDFVEQLGNCLKLGTDQVDQGQKEDWLLTLLETYLHDLDLGGIDYGSEADSYLLEYADDRHWQIIEARIKEQIRLTPPSSFGHDWVQEKLVDLLISRYEDQGNEDQVDKIIQEWGTPEQQAFSLLEQQKIDEAIVIAKKHFINKIGIILDFADRLLQKKANEKALTLMLEVAHKDKNNRSYQQWLIRYYHKYGDNQVALQWQEQAFWTRPSLDDYKTLKVLAKKQWSQLSNQIKNKLTKEERWGLLMQIALWEEDLHVAFELLSKFNYYHKSDWIPNVAEAIEKDEPEKAIDLYQELVEIHISYKQRKSYQVAVKYLVKMKKLYEQIDQKSSWEQYLQDLHSRYIRLRALADEIKKKKL